MRQAMVDGDGGDWGQEQCRRYANVEPVVAYMPEPFGTHHSKLMVLLRHDDYAQIVVHTANIVPGDWANLCQAVWMSPLLPLLPSLNRQKSPSRMPPFGSGARFKRDLLAYLSAYGRDRTGSLCEQLTAFDFSSVRAAFVASVPSRQRLRRQYNSDARTLWGWPALADALRWVPVRGGGGEEPHVVVQV